MGYLDEWNFPGDRVLVIKKGNAGDIGYRRERFFAGEMCFVLTASEYVIPKYLYHYLCSRRGDLKQRVSGVIHFLKTVDLENFPVILPPLEKQIEIVNRLNVAESYLAVGGWQIKCRRLHTKTFSGLGTRWESMSAACFDTN
ncbi:Type I restriction modification DNA specificity domain-containing protein [Fibrobacter intestinalis]|uniref:Type I restriction modification DNA specificity domain-containing protein n=1 Tax=Fibrobacter intestinalis TaxID=28122 RepID=A0A1T4RPB2_9BACT|nr:Type I restriction modification DNA specificity domain-containing protein [Fibrobacter intestinalis]